MDSALIRAFVSLTTGIYVLTVREGEHRHGMSSSWVTQVSAAPPLLVAAIDRRHFTHGVVERTGRFVLNVVGRRGKRLEDYFYSPASRRPDNLDEVGYEDSPDGLPLLCDAMVNIECTIADVFPGGDHTLFLARPARVTVRNPDQPLTSLDLEYVYVGEVVKRSE